ncbi:unnamed protein product, partial [Adineta steineri]
TLADETKSCFNRTTNIFNDISVLLKPILDDTERQPIFNRSMIRKIFGVLNNQYLDDEGHLKVFKAACRRGEHICTDIIVHHQNRQELLLKF